MTTFLRGLAGVMLAACALVVSPERARAVDQWTYGNVTVTQTYANNASSGSGTSIGIVSGSASHSCFSRAWLVANASADADRDFGRTYTKVGAPPTWR